MSRKPFEERQTFFEVLRLAEVEATLDVFSRYTSIGSRVLEVGAGRGWQARALANQGYQVEAIDLPATIQISNHARARVYPITDYDGASVPFEDAAFDVVYSSNVLEHVTEFDRLNAELHRVLKPGGYAIHLVPTTVWRASSILAHYPAQVADLVRLLRRSRNAITFGNPSSSVAAAPSTTRKILGRLFPRVHGAFGNAASELLRFSRNSWLDTFQKHGWTVTHYAESDFWATGEYLAGHALSLEARRKIAHIIGGIAHVFVLQSNR